MAERYPHRAKVAARRYRVRGGCLTLAFLGGASWLPGVLHAQSSNVDGAVALSSQLVDRGLAVTPPTPILQAAVSWNTPSNWSLGVSAATQVRAPGKVSEAQAQLSKYWSLSDDWQMQGALLYYDYPGNDRSRYFDRAEANVSWIYRDILTFGLSGIRLINSPQHAPRGAADVNFHWPLLWHFAFSTGVGVAQSLVSVQNPAYYGPPSVYRYGQAGLIWRYGPWRAELDRVAISPASRQQWGHLAPSPWVATISWSF